MNDRSRITMLRTTRYLFLSVLTLVACGPSDVSLLKDEPAPTSERLRRMDIIVQTNGGTGATPDWSLDQTITTVEALSPSVEEHCRYTVSQTPAFSDCNYYDSTSCVNATCQAYLWMCAALTFRELAEGAGDVELLLNSASGNLIAGDPGLRLHPQDVESRVGFWQASMFNSFQTVTSIKTALFSSCNAADLSAPFDSAAKATLSIKVRVSSSHPRSPRP